MALFYNVFHFLYERMAGCETAKMSIKKHVKFAHDVNIIFEKIKQPLTILEKIYLKDAGKATQEYKSI